MGEGGGGLQHHSPKTPSAAKFASQGDPHVRIDAKLNSCIPWYV